MKARLIGVPTALLVSTAILGACASNDPPAVQTSATRSVPMAESGDVVGRVGMVYRAPSVNASQYTSFIVEPVQIYRGGDADFGSASEQTKQEMARYMQTELVRALGDRVTTTPGPNVARVKVTLAGLEGNTPVVSTASRILPIGLVANAVQSARGEPGSFTGSVTYSAEVIDSTTGRPIVVAVQKRSPDAMDIGATLTSEEAQKAAITGVAEAFRKKVDQIQSASGAPRS